MLEKNQSLVPHWARRTLLAAAVYNLAWGTFVILFPVLPFTWLGIAAPNYPGLWQCIGMIVGVYGIGYGIAAGNPVRHWPIVLVGLLGKIFGPIGFLNAAMNGEFPWSAGWTILTNDLIWWGPFAAILVHAWRQDPDSFPGFLQRSRTASRDAGRDTRDYAIRVSLSIPADRN
ncbi:MAG: alkyl hydroperoxide reductase [Planctomycetaceae bacterium]